MKLDELDLLVLRDALTTFRFAEAKCFLVGAGARRLLMDSHAGIDAARATLDWDFAVEVGSWEQWRAIRERLLAADPPCFSETNLPHRLEHRCGRPIDLVPYGGIETSPGVIVWPDRNRMTVRGYAEASAGVRRIEIEPGLALDSASIPSLAVLKLIAYHDRRGREAKDIQDFDWIARNYETLVGEVRVFEELSRALVDEVVEAEHAGGMLLGLDAGTIHSPSTVAVIAPLLEEARDPYSRLIGDIVGGSRLADDARDRSLRDRTSRRVHAFELGLGGGR